ncbi:response regulator [Granulosicoccus sp. 3-233]|uniref:response regulator n=1 Tax=Granulosicoccus sp. 3-233 TaxID=3417969 RepID=UPI003D344158
MSELVKEGSMRRPSICLVDDDDMMLSLFTRVLKRTGCDVITAKGPDAAADVLASTQVDVMISDLRMPNITDGEQLLRHAQKRYPSLAVWMMSSEFCSEMRDHLMKAGAAQCIEKPFNADNIGHLIDQLGIPNLMRDPAGVR